MSRKELVVSALENGTVLDHIPAENVYKALDLLELKGIESQITIGINLASKLHGRKGIIKIADKYFTDEEINRLSVVAPNIVLNTIHNYEVVEKKRVETPSELHGIIKCNNPKCITNNEPMATYFTIDKVKGLVRCHYCDKEQRLDEVTLVKD